MSKKANKVEVVEVKSKKKGADVLGLLKKKVAKAKEEVDGAVVEEGKVVDGYPSLTVGKVREDGDVWEFVEFGRKGYVAIGEEKEFGKILDSLKEICDASREESEAEVKKLQGKIDDLKNRLRDALTKKAKKS